MIQSKGEGGELVCSGRVIATLGKWTLNGDREGLVITAKVKDFDGYHLPRTSCAHVKLTIGKATVKYAVFVAWDSIEKDLTLSRGGHCG